MGDCHTESFSFTNLKLHLNLPQDVRCFNILREVLSRIFNEFEEGKGGNWGKFIDWKIYNLFYTVPKNRSVLFLTKFHQGLKQTVIIALLPQKIVNSSPNIIHHKHFLIHSTPHEASKNYSNDRNITAAYKKKLSKNKT